jgi:hypothetical protein
MHGREFIWLLQEGDDCIAGRPAVTFADCSNNVRYLPIFRASVVGTFVGT